MRRAFAASVALTVLGALTALPLPAQADDADISLTGTYSGTAIGSGRKSSAKPTAKTQQKSSRVQVYVVQDGDQLHVTLVAARFRAPIAFDAGPVAPSTVNDWAAPFSVDEPGVSASGVLSFSFRGDGYLLAGSGRGKVFGFQGSGRLAAYRTALGTKSTPELLADGTKDAVDSLFGGPTKKPPEDPIRPEVTTVLEQDTTPGEEPVIDDALTPPAPEEVTPEAETSAADHAADLEEQVQAASPNPVSDAGYVVLVLLVAGLLMVALRR